VVISDLPGFQVNATSGVAVVCTMLGAAGLKSQLKRKLSVLGGFPGSPHPSPPGGSSESPLTR